MAVVKNLTGVEPLAPVDLQTSTDAQEALHALAPFVAAYQNLEALVSYLKVSDDEADARASEHQKALEDIQAQIVGQRQVLDQVSGDLRTTREAVLDSEGTLKRLHVEYARDTITLKATYATAASEEVSKFKGVRDDLTTQRTTLESEILEARQRVEALRVQKDTLTAEIAAIKKRFE